MYRARAITASLPRTAIIRASKRGYAVAPPPPPPPGATTAGVRGTVPPPPPPPPPPPSEGGSNTLLIAAVAAVAAGGGYYYLTNDPNARAKAKELASDAKSEAKKLEGDAKNVLNTAEGKVKGAYYDAKSSGQDAAANHIGNLHDKVDLKGKSLLSSARSEAEKLAGSAEGNLKEAKDNVKSLFK